MKSPYIADLRPSSQPVTASFLVLSRDVRQKKSGENYLALVLGDRTGDLEAKMWDNVDRVADTFDRNDFVRVKGVAQVYQNRLQFTIHSLVRLSEADIDPADFFPASTRDPEAMFAELQTIIAGMSNPHLRSLLGAIFADPEIVRKFKRAPAAKAIHHAWLGGLLEHVLSLCTLCRLVAPHYPSVDLDLLLAGAILHDIGKIDELCYERTFSYSDSGQLLGHIIIGLRIIDEKARLVPDFPPRLRTLLDHLVVSHHGELEFGSPKVPLLAEAMLLHHLDNLDSKMECIRGALERDKLAEGNWSSWVSSLDRSLLKKDKFLNDVAPPPAQPASEPARSPAAPSPRTPRPSEFADRLRQALTGD